MPGIEADWIGYHREDWEAREKNYDNYDEDFEYETQRELALEEENEE